MQVIKRNGSSEDVSFDKVLKRVKTLSADTDSSINVVQIAQKVCSRIYDGVKTSELDELAAQICYSMILDHPNYGDIASRIIISNHHKNTSPSFSETIEILYNNDTKQHLISDLVYNTVQKNKEKLNSCIDYNRDYNFDYFGFKTLEKSYLLKVGEKVIERPQHMFMRVSLGIHGSDIKDVLETYDLMSKQYCIHATPTLFNSGTNHQQMSSCFLGGIHDDSIVDIYDTLKEVAMISKYAGGIGIHIHNVRGKNSCIRGTNGMSTGIVPMLRVFNNTARYVNQCFTPETLIHTINGVKNINNIVEGDFVLTKDGEYKKVLRVYCNNVRDREILHFESTYMTQNVRVTKEHKLYVFDININEMKYIYADEFDINIHELGFPVNTRVVAFLEDCKYFRFYGLFLIYGKITDNIYNINLNDADDYNFTISFLKERCVDYIAYDNSPKNVSTINWSHTRSLNINYDYIYDDQGKKRIHPPFLHASDDHIINMLKGICKLKYFTWDDNKLVYDISFLWVRLTHRRPRVSTYNYSGSSIYSIDFDKYIQGFLRKNKLWFKVDNIRTVMYSGSVYDLNVEDNHNYVTNMGIVHNSGKRNGSMAIYLEPWHTDIEAFLELRKNNGNEEERARDLFYALWIPDLFMERVKDNGKWSLMCPDTCRGLSDVYGDDFVKLYTDYENKGMFTKQLNAQDLWFRVLESQIETGVPYMMYKDHVNIKNNQKNLGTIKSSNLCTEIVEFTDKDQWAVCNLASLCLPTYLDESGFDFEKLHKVAKILVKNLNKVIDANFYPIEKAKYSNMKHRPIGLGVQGLADTFVKLRFPFESEEAFKLNRLIFETIYHAALEASNELAIKFNKTYESFKGSPASEGILQYDMWGVQPTEGRYDWDLLKDSIKKHGLLNSLLVAPMPTASTSQICGFNESFEAFTSNIYKRKTLAGEFIIVNKYLIRDLQKLGLWNSDMKNKIILSEGSIQNIEEIPPDIKSLFKNVWEIKQKVIIDMAADRGAFVDQSQSMNLFMENPDYKKLSSMHFYSWGKGLKTGMYYLRSKAKAKSQQFTMDPKICKYTNIKNDMEQQHCDSCSG